MPFHYVHVISRYSSIKGELKSVILTLQSQPKDLYSNMEALIEQLRIANQQRFGRHTETLGAIDGQLGFFNDIETVCEEHTPEPDIDEVVERKKKTKVKGQRDINLAGFEEKEISHSLKDDESGYNFRALTLLRICLTESLRKLQVSVLR